MTNRILAFLLVLLLVCVSFTATAELTDAQIAAADKFFLRRFYESGMVGGGIMVSQRGERIYEYFYGYDNLATVRAVNENTVYKVACVSKLVSAVGLMQLVEQGKVDLDAPLVSQSGRRIANPYYPDDPVTLRQAMSHTSSFQENASTSGTVPWDSISLYNNNYFAKVRPGTHYQYGNLNGGMINSVVELASGQNFTYYMRDHVFTPLGINASYAAHLLPDTDPLSNTYNDDRSVFRSAVSFVGSDAWGFDGSVLPYSHYSVSFGGLYISLAGLEKIGQLMANYGEVDGVRLLQEDTVRQMMTDQYTLPGSSVFVTSPYGLCVYREQLGDILWYGHQGRIAGLLVDLFWEPETQTVVVFVNNGVGGTNGKQVSDRMEGSLTFIADWVKDAR